MFILVTGGSGFVGRGLVPWLAARAHAGIVTGRTAPHDLPAGWLGLERDSLLTGRFHPPQIDAIVHLEVRQHIPRPDAADITDFYRVNVEGTRHWIDWASANKVGRFVFLSSIKVAGSGAGIHTEAEISPPETPYGRSKAAGEVIVAEWVRADTSRVGTVLRPAPVYGPGNEANLAAFVRQIIRGRPCFVGNGAAKKSLVGRENLAAAIGFALDRITPGCETYNVADREVVSVKELARLVASLGGFPKPRSIPTSLAAVVAPLGDLFSMATGREFPLTTARLRAIQEESLFPSDKLEAAGFHHPRSLREGLLEMIQWIRA